MKLLKKSGKIVTGSSKNYVIGVMDFVTMLNKTS